jgi:hypothetical protein
LPSAEARRRWHRQSAPPATGELGASGPSSRRRFG